MMPAFFLCHGAPILALEENEYTRFLAALPKPLEKPKGIVIFSAHYEKEVPTITCTDDEYETIYDFYGFPEELYRVNYPAKGSTQLASLVQHELESNGIQTGMEKGRGLDHGAWVLLKHMYPNADIPVVEVSVNPYLLPAEQYKIGQAVSKLRQDHYLVIGSGGTVHNLGAIQWGAKEAASWAREFDDWLVEHVEKWEIDSLFSFEAKAPHARMAVPRSEHFVPLFITMGSASEEKKVRLLHRDYEYGTLSMLGFQFGE